MDRGFAVLVMALVGGLVAMQPAINAQLGRATGSIAAAVFSFAVGTLALTVIMVLSGQAGGLSSAFDVSWYYLLGGFCGAAFVLASLIIVTKIGAGGVAAATITGQLTLSVILDRFGFLGLQEQPITASRVAGIALLLAGTFLIIR